MRLNIVRTFLGTTIAVCFLAVTLTEVHAQRDELQVEVVEEQTDAETDLMRTRKIRESLATRVNLRFKTATLEQIAEALRDEFKIPIYVDVDAVRSLGIDLAREYEVKFENVALSHGLFNFLSNVGLGYMIKENHLVLTTHQRALISKSTYLYDVSDLVDDAESHRVKVIVSSDQGNSPVLSDIEKTIQNQLAMSAWNNGFSVRQLESANVSYVEVSCNEKQHETVRVYLDQLRSVMKDRVDATAGDNQKDGGDKIETRVYLISNQNGIEAKEYAQLVHTVFAEHFDAEKGHDLKAIAGTLVITNNTSQHSRIQQFLKDMQLLPPNPGGIPNQPSYTFPVGGGMGGMGGGGFPVPLPMAPMAPPR